MDTDREKEELRAEVLAMRARIAELERSEAERRLAEAALKEELERDLRNMEEVQEENAHFHRSLIDFLPTPVFYKDMSGRYLNCNKAFAAVMGRDTHEIIGLTVFDLQPEDIAQKYHEMDERLFSRPGVQTYETSLMYPDGVRHDVIFSKATFYNKDGSPGGLIGVILDITGRKRAEARLVESEERYRIAIEHSNDGVGILKGDRHVYVNRRFLEMFGYARAEEILDKSIYITVDPEDREMVMAISRGREKGEPVPSKYEFKGIRKDGSTIYVEVSATGITYRGEPAGLVYLRDVTESKLALNKLRDSEIRYRTLFESSNSAILIVRDECFADCNRKALEIFGCSRDQIVGKTLHRFSHSSRAGEPGAEQKIHERTSAALSGVTQFYQTKASRYDGTPFDAEINLSRIELDGEYLIQVIIQDITRRKETERELQTKSLSLEEVNTALRVLLRQRERDKDEMENHILSNVKDLVLPYVDRLKQRRLDQQQGAYLDILESNLRSIISPFMQKLTSIHGSFTPAEINVANFIRDGKTVKEIAKIIGVSESSINTHRQHIRNKLGLANQKTNLRTYLMSITK